MPESLKRIFESKGLLRDYTKSQKEMELAKHSLFTKISKKVDTKTTSDNLESVQMEKAQKVFESLSVFKGVSSDQKSIKPLVSEKLDRKQWQKDREMTAGKNWGHMAKVELTDEVKADLRAIRLRNQIFKDRFYKTADSKKLPEYFQIGTVVDDSKVEGGARDRLTKKQRKGTIAQQFLEDDQASGFSKRKYESLNDKRRRMGTKKKSIKIAKAKKRV